MTRKPLKQSFGLALRQACGGTTRTAGRRSSVSNSLSRRLFLRGASAAIATGAARGEGSTVSQNTARSADGAGDLTHRSVSELRAMLDARKVSAAELLEHSIARIEAHDPRINAV